MDGWTVTFRDLLNSGEGSLVTASPLRQHESLQPRRVVPLEDEDGGDTKLLYELLWAHRPVVRRRDGAEDGAVLFMLYGCSGSVAHGYKAVACTPANQIICTDKLSAYVPTQVLTQGRCCCHCN